MTVIYLGLYLLILAGIWGFFIVARIHAYKFKNFSTNISIVTNFLLISLIILSITGFVLIFFLDSTNKREIYVDEYKNDSIQLEQEIF